MENSEITDSKLFKFQYSQSLQAWQIIPKSNESKCIAVEQSSSENLAPLIASTNDGSLNQGFIFEKLSKEITSSATYQDNGNYLSSVTDSRGNTTSYTYDTDRGLQTSVTDAKGNTVSYSYNSLNDRLESVTSGGNTVEYGYEYGNLKNITTASGTVYNFLYDEFRNVKEISVGNQKLSENTYLSNNGLLDSTVYGNGEEVSFVYDSLDRITQKLYNGVVRVSQSIQT